jgi:hypothetical protein
MKLMGISDAARLIAAGRNQFIAFFVADEMNRCVHREHQSLLPC